MCCIRSIRPRLNAIFKGTIIMGLAFQGVSPYSAADLGPGFGRGSNWAEISGAWGRGVRAVVGDPLVETFADNGDGRVVLILAVGNKGTTFLPILSNFDFTRILMLFGPLRVFFSFEIKFDLWTSLLEEK